MLRIGFVILMICWVRMLGVIKPSRSVVLLLWVSLENFTNSHQQAYSCSQSANVLDRQLLQRNDSAMVDNINTDDLLRKLGVTKVSECLDHHCLRVV